MAWLKNFNQFLLLLVDTFQSIFSGRIWLILLCYFGVGWLALWIMYASFSPFTYPIAKGVLSLLGSDVNSQYFHYPAHLLYLPYAYGWLKLFLSVLFEGLFLGAAAILFYRRYLHLRPNEGRKPSSVFGSWGNFLVVSIVVNGLNFLASFGIPQILDDFLYGSPRRILAFDLIAMPFLYTIIAAVFICGIPAVAIYKDNAFAAMKRSVRIFFARPITCFSLAVIIWIIPILIAGAANHPDVITEKFYPELVYWVVLLGLFCEMIAYFIWMGTAARLLIEEEAK